MIITTASNNYNDNNVIIIEIISDLSLLRLLFFLISGGCFVPGFADYFLFPPLPDGGFSFSIALRLLPSFLPSSFSSAPSAPLADHSDHNLLWASHTA